MFCSTQTGCQTGCQSDSVSTLLATLRHRLATRGVGRNGLFSMGQSLITIICVFLSYRLLIADAGLASLGLWSLLMVFGGVAASFDVSGASALARSVARHDQEFPDTTRASVIHTVLLTSVAINALLVMALLAVAPAALPGLIAADQLAAAWALMPWVAAVMVTTPLAIGVSSSIDGLMRADQRAMLASAAAIIGLAVAWIAIPRIGVVGIAVAQCVQQGVVIAGGWLILRRHIAGLGWLPLRWRQSVFRRTTGYAVKLNLIGVLGLLLEPLTKYCINAAGGTTAVGIYELAARLAVQLRNLVVSSTTPLIPAFAEGAGAGDARFADLLHRAQGYVVYAALAVALLSLIAAPIMCLIILGEISVAVLRTNALLALGWSINIFSLPLYLAAQGQGVLRWNMMSHAVIGLAVILSSILLVPIVGVTGVVVGVALGLVAGAVVTMVGNAHMFALGRALRRDIMPMLATAALITALCGLTWWIAPIIARTL